MAPTQQVADARGELTDTMVSLMHTLRSLHAGEKPWLELDLTMAQLKALMIVVQTGGISSRGIADRLSIGASAVTPVVDRLIDQKLVRRQDDPSDRRVVLIRPTARSLALWQKLLETSRGVVAAVLAEVPAPDVPRVQQALTLVLSAATRALSRAQEVQTR